MRTHLALLALSLFVAAGSAAGQGTAVSPPVPPPGRMIDMGGWRLHLNCTGTPARVGAQPTVILEAGAGDFSVDWSLAQPGIARFARVCSYDRAGSAWSDLGPRPRTMRQIAWELHTLLQKAGERGPYLLVGHSFGGMLVRVYQSAYPAEVAGMVLVEAADINDSWTYLDGKPVRVVETATGEAVPDAKSSGPLLISDIPSGPLAQITAAAREGGAGANEAPRTLLSADAQRMRTWAMSQLKMYASNDNPFQAEELAALLRELRNDPHPLGDVPLMVLSRGKAERDERAEAAHAAAQAALMKLSRNSRQVVAFNSGHHIPIEQPGLVVSAVRDVLDEIALRTGIRSQLQFRQ